VGFLVPTLCAGRATQTCWEWWACWCSPSTGTGSPSPTFSPSPSSPPLSLVRMPLQLLTGYASFSWIPEQCCLLLANVSGQSFQKNSAAEKKKLGFTYFDFLKAFGRFKKFYLCRCAWQTYNIS
jgi:hypothetical protein